MERAQSQSVRDDVGSPKGAPLDVSGLEPEQFVVHPSVVVGSGTATLVGAQNLAPKGGVPLWFLCDRKRRWLGRNRDCATDIVVKRPEEVAIQESLSGLLHEDWIRPQVLIHGFGKATPCGVLDQSAGTERPMGIGKRVAPGNLPQLVCAQVAAGVCRTMSRARGPETFQQIRQWASNVFVAFPPLVSRAHPAERVKDQERLVGARYGC